MVVVHAHRAELPYFDHLAIPAVAVLLEDHRARGGELDQHSEQQQQRAQYDDRQQRQGFVQQRFAQGRRRAAGQWAFIEVDRRQPVHLGHAMVEQQHVIEVGYPDHIHADVQQVEVQRLDVGGILQ